MTACIDLAARYGNRYRITHDQATDTLAGRRDPWMAQLPCQAGMIYPYGSNLLALELDRHPLLAKQLAGIPAIRLHQVGDHERTYLFPVEAFPAVAAIVQPRRRRKLTPEHRAKLVQAGSRALASYRLQANCQGQDLGPG